MKYKIIIGILLGTLLLVLLINIKPIGRLFYPIKYSETIKKYSAKYDLDPYLVSAVIKAESNYNPVAKSSKDAYGLMQITNNTALWASQEMGLKEYSPNMLYEPDYNINMGCWYLSDLKKEFNGNVELVLAAYNGGRGNVEKWLKNSEHSGNGTDLQYIPFKETDKYVKRVNVNYNIYKFLYKSN